MSTATERIDLHDEIDAICRKLGIEYARTANLVAQLDIEPSIVTAQVFKSNKHGSIHLEDGKVASSTLRFQVTT